MHTCPCTHNAICTKPCAFPAPCTVPTMHTHYAPTASPRSFSLADLKRLHDGDYGLALHATIAGQQKTLAVSSSFRLQGGVPTAEGGGSGIKVEQGDEEEEAAEAQGERPAGDEEAAADGEEGEEEGEAERRKASLPPNGRRRRGAQEAGRDRARGQRAGRQRAKGRGRGVRGHGLVVGGELSEEDAATVGLAVLGPLQRRARCGARLSPLENAALPAMAVPVRVALLESLRLLVRCGLCCARGRRGSHRRPSYALCPRTQHCSAWPQRKVSRMRCHRSLGRRGALSLPSCRHPPSPPHASTSTEPANGSKDTSAAGKVASGAEKAGAAAAPAKYRIKRRPKARAAMATAHHTQMARTRRGAAAWLRLRRRAA